MKQGTLVCTEAVEDSRLGIEHATFKWNVVEEDKNKGSQPVTKTLPESTASSIAESEPVSGHNSSTDEDIDDHQFELKDISVVFPDRQLTLVTGPSVYE